MKKIGKRAVACAAICVLLSGCGAQETQTKDTSVQENISVEKTAETSESQLKVTTITEVFGDGQKPSAVAIEYPGDIDESTLSVDDFEITGKTITEVYTNSEAAITDTNVSGNYVILKLAYESTESADMGGGQNHGRAKEDGEPPEGDRPIDDDKMIEDKKATEDGGNMKRDKGADVDGGKIGGTAGADGGQRRGAGQQPEENLSLSVVQKGEIAGTDGTIYSGSETAIESSERIDLVAY